MYEKKEDIKVVFAYVKHIDMLSVENLQKTLPYYCKPQWRETGLQVTLQAGLMKPMQLLKNILTLNFKS
jgi:hypothetical protein